MPKPEHYDLWKGMIARCHNENHVFYHYYGGRGIRVCSRWRKSLAAFVEDMGPRPSPKHSIDRIDSNGNYEPENCRWATAKEQALGRRSTMLITFKDKTQTLSDWAAEFGLSPGTLRSRLLKYGQTMEEAASFVRSAITFNGKTMTPHQWGREVGIPGKVISQRIHSYGWTVERALTTPVRKTCRTKTLPLLDP